MKKENEKPEENDPFLFHRIFLSTDIDGMAEEYQEAIRTEVNRRIDHSMRFSLRFRLIAVAASLAILLGVGGAIFHSLLFENSIRQLTVYVPEGGGQKSVSLSDGSIVMLNAGAKLSYPSVFSAKNRQVTLDGEAFFEVAKNKKKPFIVNTGQIKITVYGTQFNVLAYNKDKMVEVTLKEGSVGVKASDARRELRLHPGEQACYDKSKQILQVRDVDVDKVTAWQRGKICFEKEPLESIAARLSRSYNVKIQVVGDELKNTLYSGEFKQGEDLEQILKVITMDKRTGYKNNGSRIYLYLK